MSLDIIEQILEMQNYSVKKVSITPERVLFQCEKKAQTYCCPQCKQQTFSGYDSTRRLVEDLPMSGKRVFIDLPISRLYCSTCHKVLTEYLSFLLSIIINDLIVKFKWIIHPPFQSNQCHQYRRLKQL